MKKIIESIKKLLGMSDKSDSSESSKGFTLIELLVVIAVIGVLAAATLIAVDPVDRLNAANDSRVQRDISSVAAAAEAYAVNNSGGYPSTMAVMQLTGDLRSVPTEPSGYTAYTTGYVSAGCTGNSCTSLVITGQQKSKKYVIATTPVFRYESATGKKCWRANTTTACP